MTPLADDAALRCRAGLAAAGRALAGDAPAETASALERLGDGAPTLPWLPGLVYRALAPLGVTFVEDDEHAVAVGAALIGRPVASARLRRALATLPDHPPPEDAPDPELAAAIDAFWHALATLTTDLGRAWRAEDVAAAQRLASQAVPELRAHAAAVAEALGEVVPDDAPPAADDPEARRGPDQPDAPAVGAAAETQPQAEAGVGAPGPAPEPAAVLPGEPDDAPVPPDRPQGALAFALIAVVIALLVLLAVLGGFPIG